MLLGDSITQDSGWFNIANSVAGTKYALSYNAGIGGNTTAGMLARVGSDVISRHPAVATLLGGTNDIGNNIPAATVISNLGQILTAMRADGEKVYIGTVPPRCSTVDFEPLTSQQKADFNAVNAWIRAQENGTTVRVVDWSPALSNGSDLTYPNLSLFGDHVHPNTAGHQVMANVLAPLL